MGSFLRYKDTKSASCIYGSVRLCPNAYCYSLLIISAKELPAPEGEGLGVGSVRSDIRLNF